MQTHQLERRSSIPPAEHPGWRREVQEAQAHRAYTIGGTPRPRVPHDGEARCPDCRVAAGELHVPGCEEERCPSCGGQVISCECPYGPLIG